MRRLFSAAPTVGISADQQLQQQYGANAIQPTSTYTRSEQTLNDDDGRTQRHTVEEHQTKTYSSGDGGSLSRTTTTSRRQMVSYSHTGDLLQQPQRKRLASRASSPSSSSYFILQHNIKQIKIITVEYKNMPEDCQRNKRSLNWPPMLFYN